MGVIFSCLLYNLEDKIQIQDILNLSDEAKSIMSCYRKPSWQYFLWWKYCGSKILFFYRIPHDVYFLTSVNDWRTHCNSIVLILLQFLEGVFQLHRKQKSTFAGCFKSKECKWLFFPSAIQEFGGRSMVKPKH